MDKKADFMNFIQLFIIAIVVVVLSIGIFLVTRKLILGGMK